eukprot:c10106_g1_i2.p1 GENE.c10106_g1_i2~~c10106_g1_i2.p1  ORF type:complete len:579 (-),score=85.47 c10106_g1_i2:157-1773(-)
MFSGKLNQFLQFDIDPYGNYSPQHELTLSAENKRLANIPLNAKYFVWAYPLFGVVKLSDEMKNNIAIDPEFCFLVYGGFVYLDERRDFIQANAIATGKGLYFSAPRPWNRSYTRGLNRSGRFQEITIQSMRAKGARYYCWLLPNETLFDETGKSWTIHGNGAFVYLFHDVAEEYSEKDCFFVIEDAIRHRVPLGVSREAVPFSMDSEQWRRLQLQQPQTQQQTQQLPYQQPSQRPSPFQSSQSPYQQSSIHSLPTQSPRQPVISIPSNGTPLFSPLQLNPENYARFSASNRSVVREPVISSAETSSRPRISSNFDFSSFRSNSATSSGYNPQSTYVSQPLTTPTVTTTGPTVSAVTAQPVTSSTATQPVAPTETQTVTPTETQTVTPTVTTTETAPPIPITTEAAPPSAPPIPIPTEAAPPSAPKPTETSTPMPIATVPPSAPRTAIPTDTSTPLPIATEAVPPSTRTAVPTDTSTPMPIATEVTPPSVPQTATPTENMVCDVCHQRPKTYFPVCCHYIYCNDCLKTVSSCGRCGEKK